MGMNFSPMYQPVSTKTIKADGDLNVNPYDLLATDVKCDTVEADEFVGGVGNFTSLTPVSMESLTVDYNIYSASIPDSDSVTINGSVHQLPAVYQSVTNLGDIYELPKYKGLIYLGQCKNTATFTGRVTASIPAAHGLTHTIELYNNNSLVATVNIPNGAISGAANFDFVLGEEQNYSAKLIAPDFGVSAVTLTFSNLNGYITPVE